MIPFFSRMFPGTNLQDLNLDWICRRIMELSKGIIAPWINSANQHWMVYDTAAETFVDSGVSASGEGTGPQGEPGKSPIIGSNGDWYTWDVDTEAYTDTGVRAEAPAITRIPGAKISIIGDSLSTFAGYIPDESGYEAHYPSGDVTDVNQTWWKRVLNASDAALEVNASAGRSRATTRAGYPNFVDRATSSVLGSPDYIFVELGTNDSSGAVDLGTFDFTTAVGSLDLTKFRPAYIAGIKTLQTNFPNAVICCIICRMDDDYANSIKKICATLGVEFVDCRGYVSSDGTHPTAYGMRELSGDVLAPTIKMTDHTSRATYPVANPASGGVTLYTIGNLFVLRLQSGSRHWTGGDSESPDVLMNIPTELCPWTANGQSLAPAIISGSAGTVGGTIKLDKSTGNVTIASNTPDLTGNYRVYANCVFIL